MRMVRGDMGQNHEGERKRRRVNAMRIADSHCVFPSPDIKRTADYYAEVLGFRPVADLDAAEPHICLYRDGVEIILTQARTERVFPNRELYGYGYDAYLITDDQAALEAAFTKKGAKIVRPLGPTDYHNQEFALEDIDGRWIGFGIKEE